MHALLSILKGVSLELCNPYQRFEEAYRTLDRRLVQSSEHLRDVTRFRGLKSNRRFKNHFCLGLGRPGSVRTSCRGLAASLFASKGPRRRIKKASE